MYICVCNAVTAKHVTTAIQDGASTLSDLRSTLKVTATCGKCASCARKHLSENLGNEVIKCSKHGGGCSV